jgi:hypothetical protein
MEKKQVSWGACGLFRNLVELLKHIKKITGKLVPAPRIKPRTSKYEADVLKTLQTLSLIVTNPVKL